MNKRNLLSSYAPRSVIVLTTMGAFLFLNFTSPMQKTSKTGIVSFTFNITVKGERLVLNDSQYTNIFGEKYRVSKFKYYISSPGLIHGNEIKIERNGYHLIDAASPASQHVVFRVPAGSYDKLYFLLGVDSARNCTGAQSGALDPMNDMFWTWNSGYVMAKLEGFSISSAAINQRMEYHIGGYKGNNKVMQKINLAATSPINIIAGKTTEVTIETDIDKWWQVNQPVTIQELPICTSPGELAKKIAVNYSNMFSIQSKQIK